MKNEKETNKQPEKKNLNLENESKSFPKSQFSKEGRSDAEKAMGTDDQKSEGELRKSDINK